MKKTFFALLLLLPLASLAAGNFVVKDMRVEGLQRISEGTVFNYLPINVGDSIDSVRIGEAIRALYGQNLFDDIEMRREEDTLVIVVKERPSIENFTIDGNKDIKTEDLMESLRNVGLARGRTFDQSVLDNVEMFLREQYYDRGKYGVEIKTNVVDRPNNTVRISIDVKEGDRAKIRQVNIVGNESFDEKEITCRTLHSIPLTGCPGSVKMTVTRKNHWKATSRYCGPSTWIAAMPTSVLNQRRSQSRPIRKTYSSPSMCMKAMSIPSPT